MHNFAIYFLPPFTLQVPRHYSKITWPICKNKNKNPKVFKNRFPQHYWIGHPTLWMTSLSVLDFHFKGPKSDKTNQASLCDCVSKHNTGSVERKNRERLVIFLAAYGSDTT